MKDQRIKAFQKFWIENQQERMSYDQAETMQHLEWDECIFECNNMKFLVVDEEEAEQKATESIENYIDDCVLSGIPERYHSYFDSEQFIEDCINIDGIAHTLSTYDGNEYEVEIDEDVYYIYRTS